jgi:hypothetical protein
MNIIRITDEPGIRLDLFVRRCRSNNIITFLNRLIEGVKLVWKVFAYCFTRIFKNALRND